MSLINVQRDFPFPKTAKIQPLRNVILINSTYLVFQLKLESWQSQSIFELGNIETVIIWQMIDI